MAVDEASPLVRHIVASATDFDFDLFQRNMTHATDPSSCMSLIRAPDDYRADISTEIADEDLDQRAGHEDKGVNTRHMLADRFDSDEEMTPASTS